MTTTVKVEHINPFLAATVLTFQSMMATKVVPGKIGLRNGSPFPFDVSGIIGLSGGAKGAVILSFPKVTALKVASAFTGTRMVIMDELVIDAVGEMANIIAGSAKRDLVQYKITISLPTVVQGENHKLTTPRDLIPLMVPFDSPLGTFCLIVSFKSEFP